MSVSNSAFGTSSSGAVSSVSNSDGSLTISPTTGSVVASLDTANANTWTANQTFSGNIKASNIFFTSGSIPTLYSPILWSDNGYELNLNVVAGNGYIFNIGDGICMTLYAYGLQLYDSKNIVFQSNSATSTTTTQNSGYIDLLGSYWNGSASVPYGSRIYWSQDSVSPSGHLSFNLNNNGVITQVAFISSTGGFTSTGYTLSSGYYFSNSGEVLCNTLSIENGQSTLSGTTAGTILYSEPFIGGNYKKLVMYASGYENTTATAQTITFPTAFINPPLILGNNTGMALTVTATTLTLPASMGAAASGTIIIEGY